MVEAQNNQQLPYDLYIKGPLQDLTAGVKYFGRLGKFDGNRIVPFADVVSLVLVSSSCTLILMAVYRFCVGRESAQFQLEPASASLEILRNGEFFYLRILAAFCCYILYSLLFFSVSQCSVEIYELVDGVELVVGSVSFTREQAVCSGDGDLHLDCTGSK